MGYYINPTNGTKEAWLNQYGMPITRRVNHPEGFR
jgi:hypothetical protein